MTVKELIRPLPAVRQLSLLRQWIGFRGSALYWEQNYARGGTSGPGSYNAAAEAKAAFLNDFARTRGVKSVIEFGCDDGHQLSLAEYPGYIDLDVSRCAIGLCQRLFTSDRRRASSCMTEPASRTVAAFSPRICHLTRRHFHLIEDAAFDTYMTRLFAAGRNFVIIYATNREIPGTAPHVRHRHFTPWAEEHAHELATAGGDAGPESRSGPRGFLYLPAPHPLRHIFTTLSQSPLTPCSIQSSVNLLSRKERGACQRLRASCPSPVAGPSGNRSTSKTGEAVAVAAAFALDRIGELLGAAICRRLEQWRRFLW